MGDIEDTYYGGRKKGREKLQQQCDRGYFERRHIPKPPCPCAGNKPS
ncbi:hypothetical protein SBF1_2820005 [Candidatus Desulfosporosinus infrequens]|uniref:Uncharacterized protein n=1 Tax=Candidatus Desulfosporosinus infrequens TaxID=2043169 RepID=A0A2U3KUK5_9FIRM|nr:hypothetical protein SBF1_2820005 [Candidatus Desulfosporosinus infrequens]